MDPLKRVANLLYTVDNRAGRLKLGMSVTIAVPAGPEKQTVMVPETALVESGRGKGVVYVRHSPTLFAEEEVILGGLFTSTLLNLFVVPAMYLRWGDARTNS